MESRRAPPSPWQRGVVHLPDASPRGRLRLAAPPSWRGALADALAVAGLETSDEAALGVAVAPARTVLPEVDEWTVDSTPHLLVAVWPHGVEVGPWVLPGSGPCARCVAAGTLDDTGRGGGRGWGRGDHPLDPALTAQAAGWVARDVLRWWRAETPLTWSASWLLGDEPVPAQRAWRRHPYCGCSWWEGWWESA